jgi:hypothetical protein
MKNEHCGVVVEVLVVFGGGGEKNILWDYIKNIISDSMRLNVLFLPSLEISCCVFYG